MIIFLTNRCNSSCTHCLHGQLFEDSGMDISEEMFSQAIQFINQVQPLTVNISGGEPTLHPRFSAIIEKLQRELKPNPILGIKPPITLITNGTFISDAALFEFLKRAKINVQITYDPAYYTNAVSSTDLQKSGFIVETHIRKPIAYGKAKSFPVDQLSSDRVAPFCFNIRSLVKLSGFDFARVVQTMEQRMKFCSWAITPDGYIIISESLTCPSVGHITDSVAEITQNIKQFRCWGCVYAKTMLNRTNTITRQQHKLIFLS